MRRARRRADELEDARAPSADVDAERERGLAGEALRLQELVGNTNTTAAIARSALQRDAAGTKLEAEKADTSKDGTYTMTVADIGTFDLVSWSWGGSDPGTGSGSGPGRVKIMELVASKKNDKHSPKLFQHSASGQHITSVELATQKAGARLVIRLKDVSVSGFRMGDGEIETITFTFADLEFDTGEKDKK